MAQNQKLTGVIKGRTIKSTGSSNGAMTIGFTDGSTMTVQTTGNTNTGSTGGTIKDVRQQDTTLHLDLDSGSTLSIPLAEETSSVFLRDGKGDMEYAD